jgi:uncharacterized repeat protein (TIGR03803 family)
VGLLATVAIVFVPAVSQAAKEGVTYSFTGGADGGSPEAGLYRDANGNLYGVTEEDGSGGCGGGGCGTVFRVSPGGREKTLHTFNGDDGAYPIAELNADGAGNLFGTAYLGGQHGGGTIFRVTPKGKTKVIHNFKGGSDGARPFAGLVSDDAGNFYGTTANGGAADAGTIYKLTPDGKESVLYAFAGGKDGVYPIGALLRDSNGFLYGTATNGGIDCDGTGIGCGIVFKLSPDGKETVLYRFEGGDHGANPAAGLAMDSSGDLYGTTNNGGMVCDDSGATCGTVYKLDNSGKETGLHTFIGGKDGSYPKSRLLIDASGNLLGTTSSGGAAGGECGCGIAFRITPGGALKILHTFGTDTDGRFPFAGLITDGNGHYFGTTNTGGDSSWGTVYKLTIRSEKH